MEYFSSIASGLENKPIKDVQPDEHLFQGNNNLIKFSKCHFRLQGTFDRHYWASIPYSFEQECRLGVSLLRYASLNKTSHNPLTLWCLGGAEGTLARSLSELGGGIINGFVNTGSSENRESFLAHGEPKYAHLYIGSYENVSSDLIGRFSNVFLNGFDIIIEDTAFQMKNADRLSQIKTVLKNLKDDGILILTEKFIGDDYDHWETIKDRDFKSHHFSAESMEAKHVNVLSKMIENQVSIDQISEIASSLFSAGLVFWNSGNFYSIALSNNAKNLTDFISLLPPPCIPTYFTRSKEIVPIFGIKEDQLTYSIQN
jgi:hypothetical protein